MKIKIFLVCSAGMSTSLVVTKMRKYAQEKDLDVEIKAYSQSEFYEVVDQYNICLVAPQISYQFEEYNKICLEKGLSCAKIEMMNYGMQRGDLILEQALALLN